MKEQIGQTYYYPNFINDEEQSIIYEWSLRNEKFLIPNPSGPFRARELFELIPEKIDVVYEIKKKIIEVEGIDGSYMEPFRGDFVSVQRNGAQVPHHTDHNPKDTTLYSRRYNVFISLPEKGGLPVYGGEVLNVPEKSLLRVDSGLIPHSTTKIEGDTPRIILSYGFAFKK
jgi:hypothetical protein